MNPAMVRANESSPPIALPMPTPIPPVTTLTLKTAATSKSRISERGSRVGAMVEVSMRSD
jgi:hypothetical protein